MTINEAIHPQYFGEDTDLYGCYHDVSDDNASSSALIICQPTGHEYERCHRAMRQLAIQSARKGIPALRFDYYSTGDSSGSSEELNLLQMQNDIKQAIKFCHDKNSSRHLTLLGLRLGASLAAQLINSTNHIDSLILYAPVLNGEMLLSEWKKEQHTFFAKHSHITQQPPPNEILGFPLTDRFQRELSQLFLPEISSKSLKNILILVGQGESDSMVLKKWLDSFQGSNIQVTVEEVENIAIWRREPMEAIVPIKAIRRILKWIIGNQYA